MASSARLRQVEVQPRRPGPPPARLDVQGDGADDRAAQGRGPAPHDATSRSRSSSPIRSGARSTSRPTGTTTTARSASSRRRCYSDNTVYEQLALDLGPPEIKQTAYDMGIKTHLDGYPAEALGGLTLGVSPLEMADAYATIASGGYRNRPTAITKITFPDGKSELPRALQGQAHQGVLGRRHRRGDADPRGEHPGAAPAPQANIGCPAAGKTGTTDSFNDAWFVGFTPRLATAVWVGYPNAQVEMTTEYHGGSVAGGTFPAEIWHDYMKKVKGKFCGDFKPPEGAVPRHAVLRQVLAQRRQGHGRRTTSRAAARSSTRRRRRPRRADHAGHAGHREEARHRQRQRERQRQGQVQPGSLRVAPAGRSHDPRQQRRRQRPGRRHGRAHRLIPARPLV